MKQHATNITSMPQTVEEERRVRMRKYSIMMAIRFACFIALIWVRGPWMFVFAAGAIFLPYFAVVIGNAVRARRTTAVERPGAVQLYPPAEWFDDDATSGDGGRTDGRPADGTRGDGPGADRSRGDDGPGRRTEGP